MAIKIDTDVRNSLCDHLASLFEGGSATLEIRSGSRPASPNSAATGTVLASVTLPSDAWAAATGGSAAKQGTWEDTAADAAGTATWFRLSKGAFALDGDVSATGGGGDLTLDNTVFAVGQVFTVTAFPLAFSES